MKNTKLEFEKKKKASLASFLPILFSFAFQFKYIFFLWRIVLSFLLIEIRSCKILPETVYTKSFLLEQLL